MQPAGRQRPQGTARRHPMTAPPGAAGVAAARAATAGLSSSASGSGSSSSSGNEVLDGEWLKGQLVRVLQWDQYVAEGAVAAVADAKSEREVEDLVEGFMGGSLPAKQAVLRFWHAAGAGASSKAQQAAPAGAQVHRKEEGVQRAGSSAPIPTRRGSAGTSQGGMAAGGRAGGRAVAPSGGVDMPGPSQPVAVKDGSKVLDMGINIPITVKKKAGNAGAKSTGGTLTAARLERPVVNCLACGRIFDCRAITNDTIQFLESGGICTFCGNQVSLRHADGTPLQPPGPPAAAPPSDKAGTAGPSTAGPASAPGPAPAPAPQLSESEVAALELKNRLVDYDRNSAKRTTVIDDQSDFFEIDSNAWLNDEERAQLKQRQREAAEAEEARRRRVTVTIDLLGRKVLMANDAEVAAAEPAARAAAEAAVQAARATAEELPQGGGTAAQAALDRAEETLRSLRISVNPSLAAANYVFLPPPPGDKSKGARPGGVGAAGAGLHAARGGGSGAGEGQGLRGRGRREARAPDAPARLQHDDPFQLDLDTAVEVLAEDEASRLLMEQSLDEAERGPFDICPPTAAVAMRPLATPGHGSSGAGSGKLAPRVEVLQPGMVLLRGWLSLAQQAEIVAAVRVLGIGPGGFYTPSYSGGGQLALKMMGLGWHWEPRTASYEQTRSSHDGATPPPIPPFLLEHVQRCLAETQAAPGVGALPPIKPDICLCNFYEKQGRLGLHQDKDESAESLRAGIPVVSFSLGDAADFAFGSSRDEEGCRVVRLESGDALVFGGTARMIYHAVRAVHAGTAPAELVQRTNLRPGRLNLTFRQK